VEFDFTAVEEAFRERLRSFLAEHPAPHGDSFAAGVEWQRTLHRGGWVAPQWPREFGGQGCTMTEYVIFLEEMGRHRAPQLGGRVGVNMVGPTILAHGTPAQRDAYLVRILSADDIWCEMFSEPNAGSDLASIATRAQVRGNEWVVSGQKVWSSFAAEANLGVLLARTGDAPGGRAALSYLICEMDRPGVDVRPLRQMTGDSEFAEVFLDDVRLPLDAVIGQPGEGWEVMRTTLANERGLAYPWKEQVLLDRVLQDLLTAVRSGALVLDAHQRDRLMGDVIRGRIFRLMNLRMLSVVAAGGDPGGLASLTKLFWADYAQRLYDSRFDFGGPSSAAGDAASWTAMLWNRQDSIAGGTSEIQRNIVAERVLGLPRERRG
jgi:alkylation response protein AidB-like acyl-CoA dehydrogenase